MEPMYGTTHSLDGTPRIQEPKTVKVGIGLPAGKAIYVFIDQAKQWTVVVGTEAKRFAQRADAQKYYRTAKATAPDRKYPAKLPFFIFTRVSPDGMFEPEWDAIEAHGATPTEIDIVFTKDEPLEAAYQMWTKTELKCKGNGRDAMRVNTMAASDEERDLAREAAGRGDKNFPIEDGCWMFNCKYAKQPDERHPSPCRPHGRLLFQLVAAPRLGGTAYYDTTAFRSISQLFSCLETFKAVTGRGIANHGFVAGIPLKLVLRPYKVSHNGQSATQHGVSLEFRANSALELKKLLVEHGVQYRIAERESLKQLSPGPAMDAPAIEVPPGEEDTEPAPEIAAAMASEFYPTDAQGPDEAGFIDPETIAAEPAVAMPRRKSEAGNKPVPVIETPEPPAASPEDLPPMENGRQLIDSLWDPEEPPVSAGSDASEKPAKENPRWKKLLEHYRLKGLPDALLFNEMGKLGFELASQITPQGFSQLEFWISQQKPKQQGPKG